GMGFDLAAVQAAAVARDADRRPAIDGDAGGDGEPEATDGDGRDPGSGIRRTSEPPDPGSRIPDHGLKRRISNAPGCHESTVTAAPQRSSPINAVSRAISVESCSGDGSGRASSEN